MKCLELAHDKAVWMGHTAISPCLWPQLLPRSSCLHGRHSEQPQELMGSYPVVSWDGAQVSMPGSKCLYLDPMP